MKHSKSLVAILLAALVVGPAFADDGEGDARPAVQLLKREAPPIQELNKRLFDLGLAIAGLPLQLRTAYAIGGVDQCETVISVSNFSGSTQKVEVEFFTGFSFLDRGLATLTLDSGETGEAATTDVVSPFVINAVRDDDTPFEGYANIHARSADIAAHAHMVCGVGGRETYQDINVFRVKHGKPVQIGD